MKALLTILLLNLAGLISARADGEVAQLARLTEKIGNKFWSVPEKRLVRATIYQKGEEADDGDSANGRSDGKLSLRHATENGAGTLAVSDWLPPGEHGQDSYGERGADLYRSG